MIKYRFLVQFIFLLSLFYYSESYTQEVTIKKTWIGANHTSLKLFDNNNARVKHNNNFHYKITNNQLKLIHISDTVRNDNRDEVYQILKLTSDTLILKSISKFQWLLGKNDSLLFIDSTKINDEHFKFEKLFFSSTRCFGPCPAMKLEIDSIGNFFFFAEFLRESDFNEPVQYTEEEELNGLYQGKLKSKDLKELKSILQHGWLDNFPEDPDGGSGADDAQYFTFVFHYNGKSKYSHGMLIPYFDQKLLSFLLNIYKTTPLEKSTIDYKFEK